MAEAVCLLSGTLEMCDFLNLACSFMLGAPIGRGFVVIVVVVVAYILKKLKCLFLETLMKPGAMFQRPVIFASAPGPSCFLSHLTFCSLKSFLFSVVWLTVRCPSKASCTQRWVLGGDGIIGV